MLRKKLQEFNNKQNDLEEAAQKIQIAEEELNFMKAELEAERRKSTVDQAKLRKVEALIAEKERRLQAAEEEFLRKDGSIRQL